MQHFSLAVIGSGSGNVVVPDDPGAGPVAIIESGPFGGTCINRGCIPSKILAYTADVAAGVRAAPGFGIGATVTDVDWPAIRDRTFARVDRTSAQGRRGRAESDRVTLFEGRARFAGPRELVIDGDTASPPTASCWRPGPGRWCRRPSRKPESGSTPPTRSCGSTSCPPA